MPHCTFFRLTLSHFRSFTRFIYFILLFHCTSKIICDCYSNLFSPTSSYVPRVSQNVAHKLHNYCNKANSTKPTPRGNEETKAKKKTLLSFNVNLVEWISHKNYEYFHLKYTLFQYFLKASTHSFTITIAIAITATVAFALSHNCQCIGLLLYRYLLELT